VVASATGDQTAEAEDDDEDEEANGEGVTDGSAKKKRKRKKKPKKAGGAGVLPTKQSSPPRVLLSNLYPDGVYPVGEEVEYRDENTYRTTSEEKVRLLLIEITGPLERPQTFDIIEISVSTQ
jgi:methionyl aminopeptidase